MMMHTISPDPIVAHMQSLTRQRDNWQAMWTQRGNRLMQLAEELEEMTRQRDMLATRCAEQARQIAAMSAPAAPQSEWTAADAIAVMQRSGVR